MLQRALFGRGVKLAVSTPSVCFGLHLVTVNLTKDHMQCNFMCT